MPNRIEVTGLKELRRELRALESDGAWKAELREAGLAAGRIVVEDARRSASAGLTTLAGTPASMGGAAIASIRALAGQTRATVAGGKASIPYFGGWEFGSKGKYRQFPRAGAPHGSHNLYRAVAENKQQIVDVYTEQLDQLIHRHFPG